MSAPTNEYEARAGILTIPLRADLAVRVQGIPFDLTAAEAAKIAAVIYAFAIDKRRPSPTESSDA